MNQTPFFVLGNQGELGPGKQGARGIGPLVYVFTGGAGQFFSVSLSSQQNTQGLLSSAQSMFVDNSAGTAAVQILFSSGQGIACPPLSQGWFPIIAPNPVSYTISCNTGQNATVSIFFTNFEVSAQVWAI